MRKPKNPAGHAGAKPLETQEVVGQKRRWLVFLWTLIIIAADQLSKWYIVANVPLNDFSNPHFTMWNGYLNIIHVRNTAIAFSIGSNLPDIWKAVLFKGLPMLVLLYIAYIVLFDAYMHKVQRHCLAIIVGGGIGNMLDRIFRPLGVVDFVDTDFWNIDIDWGVFRYSLYRWPTYNIADASVLIGLSCLLIYTFFFISKEERNSRDSSPK